MLKIVFLVPGMWTPKTHCKKVVRGCAAAARAVSTSGSVLAALAQALSS